MDNLHLEEVEKVDGETVREKICITEDTRRINRESADATVCCDKCCARVYDPSTVCSPTQISGSG